MRSCISVGRLTSGIVLLSVMAGVMAQSYPSQPITLVAPFPPGGSVDITARILAEPLGRALGGSIIVENRSGASGNVGMEAVSKAKPDGHTLVINTLPLVTNPTLFPKMRFDTTRDFTPIGMVVKSQHILVVNNAMPAKSVKELIALARERPGKLNYASAGSGSTFHLASELFKDQSKTFILHIPYRGGGPALLDTISGTVEMSFPVLSAALPHVKAGKLRALAVTSSKRSALLPDVPTMDEAGLTGYEFSAWLAILGPAGMSRELVDRINAAIAQAASAPDLGARFVREGFEPFLATPAATTTFLASETARYAKLIQSRGITPD
jgi:tripartite-type tricarboxylate transporter receptor subunit TctC